MKSNQLNVSPLLAGALVAGICSGATALAQVNDQHYPPPAGARITATLQSGQQVYTNEPSSFWCPSCVTNQPPCMLPCYFVDGTAKAQFTFEVSNGYSYPRTFEFPTSQQFDVQLLDQNGQVVAAWSDDRYFEQMETSFTLGPGQTATFIADMKLRDRNGKQLGGSYWVHAFLTNSGAQPPVEAYTQIFVVLAQQPAS